jgi:formylglycine-generating enzyme required for sulfatase activity
MAPIRVQSLEVVLHMKTTLPFIIPRLSVVVALTGVLAGYGQAKSEIEPKKNLTVDLGAGVKMEFVLIQPGSFLMGSEKGRADEKPANKVTITKPFYLGKYEVTQEQWQAVMGNNPSFYKGTNLPVEQVSWDDCQSFLAKLMEKAGSYELRLPTEAQWEYACRAGTTTEYSSGDGDANLGEHAWFTANASKQTHPVGEKKPNPWGLFDIHGNVWEWCQDWYGPYSSGDVSDPTGASSGSTRVIRGGSWSHGSRDLWSSFRLKFAPGFRFRSIGVRIALMER